MNRTLILIAGLLFILAGITTVYYQTTVKASEEQKGSVLEKIKEGEEYLKQSTPHSKERAISIFSELASKNTLGEFEFRVKYNQARALEKNDDFYPALDVYKELKKLSSLKTEDKENLSYSLGNLLLKLGNEAEGKTHIESVLQSSSDSKLRSKAFLSLADYYLFKKEYENARKNYVLSLQEDPNNTNSRIGWGRSLKKLGKDWASFDVFDEYIGTENQLSGADVKVVNEYKDSVFNDAKAAFVNKKYARSIDLFQKSLLVNSGPKKEEEALYYISIAYDALGNQKESFSYLNKVLNNGDYSLDQSALHKKGTIYFRQGKYENAASIFQTIIEKYPKNQITEKAIAWKKESLDQFQNHNDTDDSLGAKTTNENSLNSKESGSDLEF